ncbi:MAG TPA: TetR/AcrR family transcriptional regulator [Chroococcidiopsis sp.]
MGRSKVITDEQILEAAREVFLAEGFGASTVDIARRAGVSEGSIFKRFSTKEKLFVLAMGEPPIPPWAENLETLPGKGDPQENLVDLSLQMIAFFREVMPRVLMLKSKGLLPPPPILMTKFESPIQRDLKLLAAYLKSEMELGRIRPCDPTILAMTLFGMSSNHALIEYIEGESNSDESTRQFAQGFIRLLWDGLAPIPGDTGYSNPAQSSKPAE